MENHSVLFSKIKISQSKRIQLGSIYENILSEFIRLKTGFKNIKEKPKKGKRETDHLFLDDKNKKIYYAELKCNLNLDTEKSKSTVRKCLNLKRELENKEEYKDYEIKMFLVSLRTSKHLEILEFLQFVTNIPK